MPKRRRALAARDCDSIADFYVDAGLHPGADVCAFLHRQQGAQQQHGPTADARRCECGRAFQSEWSRADHIVAKGAAKRQRQSANEKRHDERVERRHGKARHLLQTGHGDYRPPTNTMQLQECLRQQVTYYFTAAT